MRRHTLLVAVLLLLWSGTALAARTPDCGPVKSRQVAAAVSQVVAELRERLPAGAEVEARLVEPQSCDRLPGRYDDIDVVTHFGHRIGRRVRVGLRLLNSRGRRVGQAWLRIEMEIKLPTVVATRRISAGDVVSESDVRVEMRSQDAAGRGACTRTEQVVGLAAQRDIATGDTLTERVLDRPVLVRRGEIVRASVYSGPLKVMRQGIAQEEGRFGDRIRLRTQDGERDFMGRVTRTGDVVVML